MKVAVLSEVRFCRVGDGSVRADASPYERPAPALIRKGRLAATSVARAIRS
jgi:hypothetical protein